VLTTVELAHRLNMRVVAEGVETAEEHYALRKTGCDEVQGYLFGKPMPADELAAWWQTRLAAYGTIQRAQRFGITK
jgi:diguanylate cyclase